MNNLSTDETINNYGSPIPRPSENFVDAAKLTSSMVHENGDENEEFLQILYGDRKRAKNIRTKSQR